MKVSRSSRLNGEYQKEISEIIRTRLKDKEPALSGIISVTEADVAPDLKTAKFISAFSRRTRRKNSDPSILSPKTRALSAMSCLRSCACARCPRSPFFGTGAWLTARRWTSFSKKFTTVKRRKTETTEREEFCERDKQYTRRDSGENQTGKKRGHSDAYAPRRRRDRKRLALSRALDVLGIENSVSDESDIPSNLSFLTGTEKIGKGFFKEADLYIAVDSADEQRLGALVDDFRAVSRKKRYRQYRPPRFQYPLRKI